MKAIVTGQVGLDKKPYLQRVESVARGMGHEVSLANVGEMMYAEAPDVKAGRILDLPLARLGSLRRTAFKDILALAGREANVIVNTHATFRWRHGLFYAFDYDHIETFDADYYVCLVDSVEVIHHRLTLDGHTDHTLKDIMVWREEEILATELLSQIVRGHGCFFIQAIGHDGTTAEALCRLLFEPSVPKAYLSFPMTHVAGRPTVLAELEMFRRQMKDCFVCFDPGDLEEKHICRLALEAVKEGLRTVNVRVGGRSLAIDAAEVVGIIPDIDGQLYARDFKLIDQADMIISYVPELPGGAAGLSSGVERELQHAHEATKDVFVIWRPAAAPSPFVTQTATRVFASVGEAIEFFHEAGYVRGPSDGLFG